MALETKYSLVELYEHERMSASLQGVRCGYCHSSSGSISDGMWGYRLTVADYSNLLQRGWRRSGKYVYKPVMKRTCCPQYAIRCDALNFKLTRSQKKVLKRMDKFLTQGVGGDRIRTSNGHPGSSSRPPMDMDDDSDVELDSEDEDFGGEMFHDVEDPQNQPEEEEEHSPVAAAVRIQPGFKACGEKTASQSASAQEVEARPKAFTAGKGPDLSRPQQRKAKDIRRERKAHKLLSKGIDPVAFIAAKTKQAQGATIETFFEKDHPEPGAHKLEFHLVCTSENTPDSDFTSTLDEVYKLYHNYELMIHKKDLDKPTKKQFLRFLAESPLQMQLAPGQTEDPVYGSYHLQYVLDGKIIGVDVLDILPDCVTSVYFFYDPAYSFLSLGTYSVLRSVYLVRQLHQRFPDILYLSLGYYVHSCPKMHYKAKFQPSFLLCPETYTWHDLTPSLAKLDVKLYQRLSQPGVQDEDGKAWEYVESAMILFQRNLMSFEMYKSMVYKVFKPAANVMRKEVERVTFYAGLVGRKCAGTMALYCDGAGFVQR